MSKNKKDRFKVLTTMQGEVMPMTKEIKSKMELEKLEKRRDEITGFNENINKQIQDVFAKNKQLQEIYTNLTDQWKVNAGALAEINRQIEEIKNSETKTDEVVEEDKSK
jgi:hypothetical protein